MGSLTDSSFHFASLSKFPACNFILVHFAPKTFFGISTNDQMNDLVSYRYVYSV